MTSIPTDKPILLLDGSCVVCNALGNRLLKIDKHQSMYISTLEGETAAQIRKTNSDFPHDLDTLIWIDGEKIYTQSDAILQLMRGLAFPHFLPAIFLIVPAFIRNFFYDIFAKHRKSWFGETNTCSLASPAQNHVILP